ncbi:protein translocase subunit yajC [Halospina denitrificans]|uniref:Sec translocon accessory complex subunit YajC n=1 Tax=Halospina denitrificans TaxID=332522 RepID=A0A4R7JTI8_9GAMM|nr:protein translocase subunit yajC [Halospina denitrificans]
MSFRHTLIALLSMVMLPATAMAAPQAGPGAISQVVLFGGFILIFYFLIWRPQSKRAKEHKALVSGLDKGDEVVTGGGLAGRITRLTDDYLVLEVSDGVEIKVQRQSVAQALPKGTLKDI